LPHQAGSVDCGDFAGIRNTVVVQILPKVELCVRRAVVGDVCASGGVVGQRGVLPDVPIRIDGHNLAGIGREIVVGVQPILQCGRATTIECHAYSAVGSAHLDG